MRTKKDLWIVDPETGDRVNTMHSGDRIIRKDVDKKLNETSEFNTGKEFIKIFVEPILKLSTELSNSEAWFMTYLLKFLDYDSGLLKHDNGKLLTIDYMIGELNLKQRTIYDLIKRLTDKGVMAKVEVENNWYYALNPHIFMKGYRVNNTLIEVFKETRWV